MKLLITGGAGYLGSELCRLLINNSFEVISLSRNHYQHLDELNIKSIVGDIRDTQLLESILTDIDVVIHLASKSSSWGPYEDFYQTNVVGTKSLIEACKNSNVKYFIFASSASVAFKNENQNCENEEVQLSSKFHSFFSITKAKAENIVIKNHGPNLKTIVLRFPILWGKENSPFVSQIITKARKNQLNIIERSDVLVDILYITNAAQAILNAVNGLIENPSIGGNTYFVSQEKPVKIWEFINQILTFYKIDPVEDILSFNFSFKLAAIKEYFFKLMGIYKPGPSFTKEEVVHFGKDHFFSNEKANQAFNYNPLISIEEGLKETYSNKILDRSHNLL